MLLWAEAANALRNPIEIAITTRKIVDEMLVGNCAVLLVTGLTPLRKHPTASQHQASKSHMSVVN
jgi:hypothetical protein